MSKFRYLTEKTDTISKPLDARMFEVIGKNAEVNALCDKARAAIEEGDKEAYQKYKGQLPLALWTGYNEKGERDAAKQTPTQYYIMDIDHAKLRADAIWEDVRQKIGGGKPATNQQLHDVGIRIVHETPSGGVRFVNRCIRSFTSVSEHMQWFAKQYGLGEYGDVDEVVKDLSRCSFMVKADWVMYHDKTIWEEEIDFGPIVADDCTTTAKKAATGNYPTDLTEEERLFKYKGKLVADIAQEYVDSMGGVPEDGQRHAMYNELIKNFRNICDNEPRILFAVLPMLEGDPQKRWSQCTSICKTNNTTMLPKEFYYWMRKHGYVTSKKDEPLKELLNSEPEEHEPVPKLPPVFREYCSVCPPDFVYPTIIALLPIMGTLTSYVKSDYFDSSEQTTTFFSTIYAPPGSNKSFAGRLVDQLMTKIKLRDEINNLREQLWLVDTRTKSDNEKGKDLPHVMVRIMPAINSLPEFLEKMRDNKGYHMFTFAEEVDTFKKGSSSGGADKSDLFRTAWDNSLYGQSFKSAATFKGMVKVYYNILLTGTKGATKKYYSNVEDGMVTRVSICQIENQRFAKFQKWKPLNAKQMKVIDAFIERCERNTYAEPCEMTLDEVYLYNNSSEFDKHVDWRFKYNPRKSVDMSFLEKTIMDWLEKYRLEASLSNDDAMDTFRRRTAVKGFRLGLVCMCCWEKPTKKEQDIIKKFVRWFMDRDLKESLAFFGKKYNDLQNDAEVEEVAHNSLFDSLPNDFSKNDVIAQCIKQGIKSRVRQILYRWKQDKAIIKTGQDTYKKAQKK